MSASHQPNPNPEPFNPRLIPDLSDLAEEASDTDEPFLASKPAVHSFFERNTEQRKEIVEGLIREQQLGALGGPYGMGKSPSVADLVVHILSGIPWCGRKVDRRPVIHIDLETPGPVYKANLQNIATRLGVSLPRVPEELDVYLEHGAANEPPTKRLLDALGQPIERRFDLIEAALRKKPNALVVIDPLELLFRIDTGKKLQVLWLYGQLRFLLTRYPHAAVLLTFNLRKLDKKTGRADLLTSPREWLEEVCGTLDILNRSDVRLGIDVHDEEVRVINGIRRGEDMHPLLIRPVSDGKDNLAGFELCPPAGIDFQRALTPKQLGYWDKLPKRFRFEEMADKMVPRASLQRLLDRVKSLGGIIRTENGMWEKQGDR